MHIVLIGDSVLDNASYVDSGESIQDLLHKAIPNATISLLAVDGSMTTDISKQIANFAQDATHIIFSCGGNDAINSIDVLNQSTSTIEDALLTLAEIRQKFRQNYISALKLVSTLSNNVAACTIYNKVPLLDDSSRTALALFNEIILEELSSRQIPIIDLRVIFNDESDFSPISPIEPSVHGGRKLVLTLEKLIAADFKSGIYV